MATRTKKAIAIRTEKPAAQLRLIPPNIIDPESEAYEMPEGFDEYDTEEVGGLHPVWTPERAGEAVWGKYQGTRTLKLGDREQNIHHFLADEKISDKKGGLVFGVWGSTVLDNRILEASPKTGDMLFIRFTGLGKNASKGNPAKLYQVVKLKPKK